MKKSKSLWQDAFQRLLRDKAAVVALVIVVVYALIALLSATGLIASDWNREVGASYLAPGSGHWFGTDIFGRDVLTKIIHGTQIAMSIGFVTSLVAIPIGITLGAIAGYFGGWIDEIVVWLYTTMTSIPNIILLISITMVLGKGIMAVYIALGATSWVGFVD